MRAAEGLQLQAGGGDDDVGVEVLPGLQRDAGGVEVVDVVGDHLDAAVADRREQVAVGVQADALIPRVVARLEVHVDRIADGQVRRSPCGEACRFISFGSLRDTNQTQPSEQGVAPLGERVRDACAAATLRTQLGASG